MIMQCTAAHDLLSVGFDQGELTIEFIFGGTYIYHGVPESVYQELIHSDSQCMYFLKNIKDFYWFTRINKIS